MVVAGLPVAARVFHKLDRQIVFAVGVDDGQEVVPGTVPARLTGPVAAILTGETASPFSPAPLGNRRLHPGYGGPGDRLQSGFGGHPENHPGLARPEKYAVRLGGGRNHRLGLYDEVLIKNNHLTVVGGIRGG